MYEKLTESLRKCGRLNTGDECVCFHDGCCEAEPTCMYELMRKAADTIEKLAWFVQAHAERAMVWAYEAEKATEKLPRWVSVTERLPEDGTERVLVYANGDGIEWLSFITTAHFTGSEWRCGWNNTMISTVTHWMPLPQAPEPPKDE